VSKKKKKKKEKAKLDLADLVTIPFSDLVLYHREIGVHRGRKAGFRDVFDYDDGLDDLPFTELARKVKAAYEGTKVPKHKGWSAQREALQWFVEKGTDAMYQFKDDIRVRYDSDDDTYYIVGGHHRALALYILGADSVRVAVED